MLIFDDNNNNNTLSKRAQNTKNCEGSHFVRLFHQKIMSDSQESRMKPRFLLNGISLPRDKLSRSENLQKKLKEFFV